jgi:hypothetical protein
MFGTPSSTGAAAVRSRCAILAADVATDVRAPVDAVCRREFLKRPSQTPAPAPGLLLTSWSNPDPTATSRRCARRGRHPPCGTVVAVAGYRELDSTVINGAQEVASTTALGQDVVVNIPGAAVARDQHVARDSSQDACAAVVSDCAPGATARRFATAEAHAQLQQNGVTAPKNLSEKDLLPCLDAGVGVHGGQRTVAI